MPPFGRNDIDVVICKMAGGRGRVIDSRRNNNFIHDR